MISQHYTLNIKSRTVGDGQHGTARWATRQEIHRTYHLVRYTPQAWRKGKDLPKVQGIIAGSIGKNPVPLQFQIKKKKITLHTERLPLQKHRRMKAIVDGDDIHCMMIGASGAGKTAYFLYPNLEYTWRWTVREIWHGITQPSQKSITATRSPSLTCGTLRDRMETIF